MLMSSIVECLKRFTSAKPSDEGGGVDPEHQAPADVTKLLQGWMAQNKENVKVSMTTLCLPRYLFGSAALASTLSSLG